MPVCKLSTSMFNQTKATTYQIQNTQSVTRILLRINRGVGCLKIVVVVVALIESDTQSFLDK